MPEARAVAGASLSDEVHSAFSALGDEEYRRWQESCEALEGPHEYPWAETESRALVATVLGCLFGDELTRLDAPARDWARTGSTMAVFARRLGCLRELIGQEGVLNGPEATLRAHQIFDRVTIVGTEAALASLTYSAAGSGGLGAAAELESPEGASEGARTAHGEATLTAGGAAAESAEEGEPGASRPRLRRRTLVVLLTAALVALVTAVVFALSPAGERHPSRDHHGTKGATNGATPTGATVANGGGTGAGSSGNRTPSSRGSGGGAGSPGAGSVGGALTPGTGGPAGGSTGGESNGSGSTSGGGSPGGTTLLTLPGGAPVTVPNVTVPTVVPGLTIPGLTLPTG
ncbi:MAG TPA: hypothetical protein VKU86_15320 [Acidimicrobiales bacterium]|nr:hypothetical protein [Acidimicrobiales bacterium]